VSCSSSTTPARRRTVLTWILLGTWGVLIAFGLVSLSDPNWLEDLSRRGQTTEAYMGRYYGDDAFKRGNYAKAIAEYRRATEILPDAAGLHVNLGVAYVKTGDLVRGRAALNRASQLSPTPRMQNVIALYLGDAAAREGRSDEALAYYRQAQTSAIREDLALRRIAGLALESEDYPEALADFQKVLAIQTDPRTTYRDMVDRAREIAEDDSAAAAWMRSAGARALTDADWARFDTVTIRRMLNADREIAKTHNHLGFAYYQVQDLPAAARHFERSLAIWPGNQDAVRNLGVIKARQ
jgi:tetratricopeptide (TPR) repeat protein